MKKYFFTFILTVLLIPGFVNAQQKGANISFDNTTHDFGTFDESNGVVTYKFEFTNTGSQPLIIQNASPSCGCTTPAWTNGPVKPGERGFVSAAYNPSGRPGKFEKTITVQSTAQPPVVTLIIKGNVNEKPLRIEDQYPYVSGGIRLKTNQVPFGTVYKGEQRTNMIEILNATDIPQTVKIDRIPPHLKINIPQATLAPKQTGIIEISFNSALKDDWGYVSDYLYLTVNNTLDSRNYIVSTANIDENFSALTAEQKAQAPSIAFDNVTFNFGTIKHGETVSHDYKFTNKGKSNLLIRKVTASCGCTAVMASEQVIAPGKTGVIRATFDSTGKTGRQDKTVTVITNDPISSKIMLLVRGEVIDASKADNTSAQPK